MDNNVISGTGWDLVYLVYCALHGVKPTQERVKGFDLKVLYRVAKFHSVIAMAAVALEGQLSPEDMAPWKEAREKALRKNIVLDLECRQICAVMQSWGIWHMPLKGYIIKGMYPSMEMRQMSDQDILFDTSHKEKMRQYMQSRGYELESEDDEHHDIYRKEPVYNIELHHSLIEDCQELNLEEYYKNIEERMIQDAPGSFSYHLSDEDFYIYMVAHACKHYFEYGTGLRTFTDVYVYVKQKGETLDWDYIRRECKAIGMDWYEQQCRSTAMKLFSQEEPEAMTDEELEMIKHCFNSGTYGTMRGSLAFKLKQIQNDGEKISSGTKFRYLIKRLFPSLDIMKRRSPMVKKYPWTLPLGWIARLARGIFKKGKLTAFEFNYVMDAEEL